MNRKKYVVIMAAGSGSRMGGETPKQFLEVGGKTILRRTIEAFAEAIPGITVITVLPEDYMGFWKNSCYNGNFVYPQILVKGGITRFHSVRNALEKVPDGALVAIHDGVRPLAGRAFLREMFEKAQEHPGLIPVIPCVDTMTALKKKVWDDGSETFVRLPQVTVDRSVLYAAQTPQIFHSELLKSAYNQAFQTSFTDDASVVEAYGKNLSFVKGERLNIKITTPEDLILAEAILKVQEG